MITYPNIMMKSFKMWKRSVKSNWIKYTLKKDQLMRSVKTKIAEKEKAIA